MNGKFDGTPLLVFDILPSFWLFVCCCFFSKLMSSLFSQRNSAKTLTKYSHLQFIVLSFTWFDFIHEQRPAYGLSASTIFVHGIINILDQLVTDLDVLAADCGYGFWIPVGLLVWLRIVVIMITEPWQESTHDGPATEHLGVNNLSLKPGMKRTVLE